MNFGIERRPRSRFHVGTYRYEKCQSQCNQSFKSTKKVTCALLNLMCHCKRFCTSLSLLSCILMKHSSMSGAGATGPDFVANLFIRLVFACWKWCCLLILKPWLSKAWRRSIDAVQGNVVASRPHRVEQLESFIHTPSVRDKNSVKHDWTMATTRFHVGRPDQAASTVFRFLSSPDQASDCPESDYHAFNDSIRRSS